ncbi:MAG: tyrosine-type recombinase/integrase, partial [Desulfobacteraceae bacterium]|nr:tyrosine-type recombinase/integrase [Desulfobacteraceae bacterium]
QGISYRNLLDFTARYNSPSVHVKKARVWALRQFYHYLMLHNVIAENIASGLRYPKIEKTITIYLTIDEYNRLLEYFCQAADSFIGLRNLAIILMLGILGFRTSTIISLNIQDVDIFSGLVRITEKGGRNRPVALPAIICGVLAQYLDHMPYYRGPLFITERHKRASPRTLQHIFRHAADHLDIDKHLHAHLFRHTAATHLNKVAGTNIAQSVLGHSQRKNTLKYAHLNPDKYAEYMRRHPFMKFQPAKEE